MAEEEVQDKVTERSQDFDRGIHLTPAPDI